MAGSSKAAGAGLRRVSRLAGHLQPTSEQRTPAAASSNGNGAAATQQPPPPGVAADGSYRQPPPEIAAVVDAPVQPNLSFSPDRSLMMQTYRPPPYPPVSELARPELKLAGLRIDPETWSRSRMGYTLGIGVAPVTDELMVPLPPEKERRVTGVPPGMWLNYVSWSPDSKRTVFTLRSDGAPGSPPRGALELWAADVDTLEARPLLQAPEYQLNTIFDEYVWLDDEHLIATVIPEGAGPAPQRPNTPSGPKIEDNSGGGVSQSRTFTDLLKNGHDEATFEYYSTASLVTVHVPSGNVTPLAGPRMYTGISPSPDGQFVLVSRMERPFSYSVPCGRFPKRVELWDRDGKLIREIAYLPLAESIPTAFNSCREGPRGIGWRDDKPAEVSWVECQDGGDPGVEASPRDIIYTLPAGGAAAGATPVRMAGTDMRCGGVVWGDDDLALVYESEWKTRRSVISLLAPSRPEDGLTVLFDRNYEDVYNDPGSPALRRTAQGTYVLAQLEGARQLLLQGSGASPKGNRPFLDVLDLETKETRRIWQSAPPFYEGTGSILSDLDDAVISLDNLRMLMTRESVEEPPQYYMTTFSEGGAKREERCISNFPHPYPTLKGLSKEILRYKRSTDGVELTGTLYLPPGYERERDGALPCLLWAYPKEYKSKDAASQLRRSPYEFSGVGATSPLLWLARGYAVLDGPGFPIIAEGDEEPNDTYVEQLTASARAAIDELTLRGIVDPKRVAIGGHSYGAFMTANLLAHAPDLFACGIARSGAYNRTLTPFGFQAEERSMWQAPETYTKMSPFMNADKISKPILLIHGEDDNNTGTFPMQSERMYSALKGHGATCRLVILPHESHGYRGKESIMHTLFEMDAWLQRYCEGDAEVPPPAAEEVDRVEEVVLPAAAARAEEVP